jgi:hypothetical protein
MTSKIKFKPELVDQIDWSKVPYPNMSAAAGPYRVWLEGVEIVPDRFSAKPRIRIAVTGNGGSYRAFKMKDGEVKFLYQQVEGFAWSELNKQFAQHHAWAHISGVWTVTNSDGRWFSRSVYLTKQEAEWLAWSLSTRNVMDAGVSFAECHVIYVERYLPSKHVLNGPLDLNLNKIDPNAKVAGRPAGPGNYKVIEPKSFRDQLRRDTLNAVIHPQDDPQPSAK